jgi:hypothetical protein
MLFPIYYYFIKTVAEDFKKIVIYFFLSAIPRVLASDIKEGTQAEGV